MMRSRLQFFIISMLLISPALAEIVTVPGVKVSIQAESAAAAREKAIAQGHVMAFERALSQLGMEASEPTPGANEIMAMTKGFSPDIEKQTSTSYAASFTFRFDDQDLRNWVQPTQQHALAPFPSQVQDSNNYPSQFSAFDNDAAMPLPEKHIQVEASLQSFGDLVAVEKLLSQLPLVKQSRLIALTREQARFDVRISGEPEQFRHVFGERGWSLEENSGVYVLTPNFRHQG